jgi:hypothetical protein
VRGQTADINAQMLSIAKQLQAAVLG